MLVNNKIIMKDIIHFSHANGFPSGCYSTLFSLLDNEYEIGFIDRLGHQSEYPVTDNWRFLAQELIHFLETHYRRPVVLLGHSLGGVLSLMVADQRPDLVKGLVLLDAPFLTPFESRSVRWIKRFGLIDKVTPAGRTLGRKECWGSYDEALDYFKCRRLFKQFDPRCLKDYVHHATRNNEQGRRQLYFDAATEIKIYRTIPHNIYNISRLSMPIAVLAGRGSDVFKRHHGKRMEKTLQASLNWLDGGHMFPFERPEETAALIQSHVSAWG